MNEEEKRSWDMRVIADRLHAKHTYVHPGEKGYEARTPFVTFAYIAHGNGYCMVNGEKIDITEGTMLLVHENITLKIYSAHKEEGVSVYGCLIDKDEFKRSIISKTADLPCGADFFENRTNYLTMHDGFDKTIRNYYVKLMDEFTYTPQGYRDAAVGYIKLILITFFRMYDEKVLNNEQFKTTRTDSNRLLGETLNYIEINLRKRLALKDTAEYVMASPQYICRMFKKYFNMTYTEYINRKRVELIKSDLENTDRAVWLICNEFELTSQYLYEIFKRYTGMSMAQYKRKYNPKYKA